ncbi:hypothetical protein C492_11405 [Natronococcus jeotgali DSM 18795]|uniref:Uncharacterized protein n=1 Tax=Natronococcus jeotgali DSM 18795 TaxID=1227498 RepID=L9XC77_9EURY|nr:hypothetical protein C492_11405 [Natronococcus jeotgali DSM 18795]
MNDVHRDHDGADGGLAVIVVFRVVVDQTTNLYSRLRSVLTNTVAISLAPLGRRDGRFQEILSTLSRKTNDLMDPVQAHLFRIFGGVLVGARGLEELASTAFGSSTVSEPDDTRVRDVLLTLD